MTESAAEPSGKRKKSKQPDIDFSDSKAVVEQYTPYVRSIAGKVRKKLPPDIEFDDLVEYLEETDSQDIWRHSNRCAKWRKK